MKRFTVERRKPGFADRRRVARFPLVLAYVRSRVAEGLEAGHDPRDLGEALMQAGADLVASTTDGQGAASALGATAARVSLPLVRKLSWREADQALRGGRE